MDKLLLDLKEYPNLAPREKERVATDFLNFLKPYASHLAMKNSKIWKVKYEDYYQEIMTDLFLHIEDFKVTEKSTLAQLSSYFYYKMRNTAQKVTGSLASPYKLSSTFLRKMLYRGEEIDTGVSLNNILGDSEKEVVDTLGEYKDILAEDISKRLWTEFYEEVRKKCGKTAVAHLDRFLHKSYNEDENPKAKMSKYLKEKWPEIEEIFLSNIKYIEYIDYLDEVKEKRTSDFWYYSKPKRRV